MLAYCRSHLGSCWAILGSGKGLSLGCTQLRHCNMNMAAIVRALAPEALTFCNRCIQALHHFERK
ncbi:unnamed protein product [Gongylonema pulchrum]|uniref:Uncharacterized protein n=1 Tax=Gongylonema pulchrum TaxID=637853 RepID=A0A3P7MGR6_9BILA|nr:unnamed protein product [Gongylonema pulchrum]